MKRKFRCFVDIAMTLLVPVLMAYTLAGEALHEVLGTVMFALFLVHHHLNRKWYGAMLRGRYTAARVFQAVLNVLLPAAMILQAVSGILLSKHLYTFLPVLSISAQARSIHMLLAYWGYVLLGLHAGTHLAAPLAKLRIKRRGAAIPAFVLLGAVSVYGCFAFGKREFPAYLFAKTAFAFYDFNEPIAYFLLDYLAVMILCMTAGLLILRALSRRSGKHKRKAE